MSGYDYAKSASTALRLIERFGQEVTIVRTEVIAPTKPWNPSSGDAITTEYKAQAVVTQFSGGLIDGESVRYGDKQIIVAAKSLAIEPHTADTVKVGGVSYSIIRVDTVSPAGTALVYNIQARV